MYHDGILERQPIPNTLQALQTSHSLRFCALPNLKANQGGPLQFEDVHKSRLLLDLPMTQNVECHTLLHSKLKTRLQNNKISSDRTVKNWMAS